MNTMLETGNLIESVASYWRNQFPEDCLLIEPGLQGDASRQESWIELAFPVLRQERQRRTGLQSVELLMDTHCFAVLGEDAGRVRRLVDAVRAAFAGNTLMVRDYGLSALPAVGYVKFGEAEVRDLTRVERRAGGRPLAHYLVSLRGVAHVTEV